MRDVRSAKCTLMKEGMATLQMASPDIPATVPASSIPVDGTAAEQQPGRQHHEGEQDGFFQSQLPGKPGRGSSGHRETQCGDRGQQGGDQRAVAQDSLQVVEERGGAGDAGAQVEPDEHEGHDAGHDHAARADRAGWSCLGKCGNRRAASHT